MIKAAEPPDDARWQKLSDYEKWSKSVAIMIVM